MVKQGGNQREIRCMSVLTGKSQINFEGNFTNILFKVNKLIKKADLKPRGLS